jgi:hypothetical protein
LTFFEDQWLDCVIGSGLQVASANENQLHERLQKEGIKTHKERVEELNKYLSRLSEHHDMYVSFCVSPKWWAYANHICTGLRLDPVRVEVKLQGFE